MYLYLTEDVTGRCGDLLYNKSHLIDMDIPPVEPNALRIILDKLSDIAYMWYVDGMYADAESIKELTPNSTWRYDLDAGDWVETVLISDEEEEERRRNIFWPHR